LALNTNVAQYYNENQNYNKAIEYLKRAENLIDKNKKDEAAVALYNTFGEYYMHLDQYSNAIAYLNKALSIARKMDYKRGLASIYGNFSTCYQKSGELTKALEYAKLSLQTEESIGNAYGIITSLTVLAEIETKINKPQKAKEDLLRAEKISLEKGIREPLPEIYYQLSQINRKEGDYKTAYENLDRYTQLNDSLTDIKHKEKISELEIKYQSEKKQQQIALLETENELKQQGLKKRNLLIALLFSLLLMTFLFVRNYKQRTQNKMQQINQQLQQYLLQLQRCGTDKKSENSLQKIVGKYDLTERESEILTLVCQGKSNSEIANTIFVSTNTVKFHIKNIYVKMDVKNRMEARNLVS
jgi:ATP/maltotriose-dependent transcriptional regulator MalT